MSANGAPISISQCKAVLTTTKDTSGNSVPHLWVDIVAKNGSQNELKAVKVLILNYDAFGNVADAGGNAYRLETFTIEGDVDPGDTGESADTFDNVAANIGRITCVPAQAAFSNGDTWSNPEASE